MLNTVYIDSVKSRVALWAKTTFIVYMDIKTHKKIAKHKKSYSRVFDMVPSAHINEPIWPMLQIYQKLGVILM